MSKTSKLVVDRTSAFYKELYEIGQKYQDILTAPEFFGTIDILKSRVMFDHYAKLTKMNL